MWTSINIVWKSPSSIFGILRDAGDSLLTAIVAMWSQMAHEIVSPGITDWNEWAFLLSDISVKTFYPAYLMEKIRKEYSAKTMVREIAVKHLDLLEKSYKK